MCIHIQAAYNAGMFERCIYFNLNSLSRDINRIWDDAFQRQGLSPAHGYLLRLVLNEPGITQKEIAQNLNLDPSTVTRFIDALSAKKYIRRQTSPDNVRTSQIFPTAKAEDLHADLERTGAELYATLRKKIGAQRFDRLVKELRAIRQAISDIV